jgi:hypothetical protein
MIGTQVYGKDSTMIVTNYSFDRTTGMDTSVHKVHRVTSFHADTLREERWSIHIRDHGIQRDSLGHIKYTWGSGGQNKNHGKMTFFNNNVSAGETRYEWCDDGYVSYFYECFEEDILPTEIQRVPGYLKLASVRTTHLNEFGLPSLSITNDFNFSWEYKTQYFYIPFRQETGFTANKFHSVNLQSDPCFRS